uniref:Uncharacterized protein n=1 Tax=Anguilla anguilla TaxID=7936 RepID=A0A0E9XZ62_ANGAN
MGQQSHNLLMGKKSACVRILLCISVFFSLKFWLPYWPFVCSGRFLLFRVFG